MTVDEKLDRLTNDVHLLGVSAARIEGSVKSQNALLGQYRNELQEVKGHHKTLEGRIWGIVIAVAGFGLSSLAALVLAATSHGNVIPALATLSQLF